MSDSQLLTEAQRQDKYLSRLPQDFEYPLFNSVQALESQRKSGYRNTAAAAREIVDNAIEAGASRVHVVFDRPRKGDRAKYQRKNTVVSVAFIDDGPGMSPEMARFALSWGGGTHFDLEDQDFIGRFGFGLPNSSINQTRRVEVYTRRSTEGPFWKAWLDINEIVDGQHTQSIPEPVESELPDFVAQYLEREHWTIGTGTVVVWVEPDRLSYRTDAVLREHLLHDFGTTYRYLLDSIDLVVAGKVTQRVDPLFLMPDALFYRHPDEGGARLQLSESIPIRYFEDGGSGERHLERVDDPKDLEDSRNLAVGAIEVTIVRLPPGLAVGGKGKAAISPVDDDSGKRFTIRKSRRGMSFVRAKREIETVDAFPRSGADAASGLGDWPLLQSYAYHWGIEVRFPGVFDEVFGITNDKQTVRPIEDFWVLLAAEGVDAALNRENAWQESERKRLAEMARTASLNVETDGPSPAEFASQTADAALGEPTSVPDHQTESANLNLENRAHEQATLTGEPLEEVRELVKERQKGRKYRIEYVDLEYGPFFVPRWEGLQIVVQVNQSHPFFSTLYGSLLDLPGGGLAKEAVDVLLVALARGEVKGGQEETTEFYRSQREHSWSPFLSAAMRTLARQYPALDEEEEESVA